ncbi:hypothetical protein [Winogradskyella sp.]|uniref:hypothetical protein n=1 Tax=Winogradskyella sp. TaxID=1883156 RepID=UPI0025D19678|nr:hypothetical protein [Winogradskyella sp.]
MELISLLFSNALLDDSSERIIGILSIALATIISLLILSLFKAHKLKARIKELEEK